MGQLIVTSVDSGHFDTVVALTDQKRIKRAMRIIQRCRQLSAEQAYRVLRNRSRRQGISTASLANEIVTSSLQRKLLRRCPMG
jgi:AmiR/NasT family two-component response regulator